jgi:hypothetical protein
MVEAVLAPGMVSRAVHHRTVEEIWYFLAGTGQVWIRSPDGETERTQRVAPGWTVTICTGWDGAPMRMPQRRSARFTFSRVAPTIAAKVRWLRVKSIQSCWSG